MRPTFAPAKTGYPPFHQNNMSKHIGKVVQVIGPVVDVRFESGKDLPNIYDALHVTRADGSHPGAGGAAADR